MSKEFKLNVDVEVIAGGRSTNGRWGLQIVGPKGMSLSTPKKGRLFSIGKIDGKQVYKFNPDESGRWFLAGDDLEPVEGCEVVQKMDLQSNDCITIIAGGDVFAVKSYGYKRRSATTCLYKDGVQIDIPAPVMLALGLIPNEYKEVETTSTPLSEVMSAALKKAGI